jgi:hypothetical protein
LQRPLAISIVQDEQILGHRILRFSDRFETAESASYNPKKQAAC